MRVYCVSANALVADAVNYAVDDLPRDTVLAGEGGLPFASGDTVPDVDDSIVWQRSGLPVGVNHVHAVVMGSPDPEMFWADAGRVVAGVEDPLAAGDGAVQVRVDPAVSKDVVLSNVEESVPVFVEPCGPFPAFSVDVDSLPETFFRGSNGSGLARLLVWSSHHSIIVNPIRVKCKR